MADQFDAWTTLLALANKHKTKAALRDAIGKSGLRLVEDDPLSGYYRCAAVKDGPLLPVAIWREGERLFVMRAGASVELRRVWPYCAWNPVSYEWFEAFERDGKWPDEPADAARAEAEVDIGDMRVDEEMNAREQIGANRPPEEDETSALTKKQEADKVKAQIEQAIAAAKLTYASIESDEQAAAAQAARSNLNTISNNADKRRKALMNPWESKAKAIHEVWMPLVKQAKDGADTLRDFLRTWERKKDQMQCEAAAKAAAEAAEKAAAEQKMAPTATGNVPISHNEPPVEEEKSPAPAIPPSTGIIKGATGRAARVFTKKTAIVTDYDKLYAHIKAFPEIKEAMRKVAQRLVNAGQEVPGVEVNEERDVA